MRVESPNMNMPNEDKTPNEEIYTTEEFARAKRLHPSTVRKLFLHEPGVLRLGRARRRGQRQYYTLRIPRDVAERVFLRLTVQQPAEAR
jgi:hypothetical protein